jgi:hypothetical protein
MPIPNLPPLGSARPAFPSSLSRFQQDLDLPVPDVAGDPTQLVARALAILVEETEAWQKRAVTSDAAAREFDQTAFAGVSPSPDLDWLRSCVEFLARRDS